MSPLLLDWLRADRQPSPTRRWVLVGGLLALQTLAVGLVASRSYFFVDDFLHFIVAQQQHSPYLRYLRMPVFQHFIPGHRLVFWGLQHYFPLDFGVALAFELVFHALSSLVLLRLLRRLCSLEAAALITLIWAVSPIYLRTAGWVSAGIQYFPCNFFTLLALERTLAYWASGRRIALALAAVALALGLGFFVKALLVVGYLPLLWVLFPALRPTAQGVRRTATSLAVLGAVAALYLAVYLKFYYFRFELGGGPRPSLAEALQFSGAALVHVFLPAFFGSVEAMSRGCAPCGWTIVAALVLVCWRAPRAARALLFFLLAALPNVLLVAITRIKLFPPNEVMLDLRYYTELAFLLALALGGMLHFAAERRAPAAPVETQRHPSRLALALALLALGGWGFAMSRALPHVAATAAGRDVRPYVENLRQGLEHLRRQHRDAPRAYGFYNYSVPPYVLPRWFGDAMLYGSFFTLFPPAPRTDFQAQEMYALDTDGRVRPARLRTVATAQLPPGGRCVAAGQALVLELTAPADLPEGTLELTLEGSTAAHGAVLTGSGGHFEPDTRVEWDREAQEPRALATFDLPRRLSQVRLELAEDSAPVCLTQLRIGAREWTGGPVGVPLAHGER